MSSSLQFSYLYHLIANVVGGNERIRQKICTITYIHKYRSLNQLREQNIAYRYT